jgi:hypothetical protein
MSDNGLSTRKIHFFRGVREKIFGITGYEHFMTKKKKVHVVKHMFATSSTETLLNENQKMTLTPQ